MRYTVCSRPWFLGLASVVFLSMSNITLLLRVHSTRPPAEYSEVQNQTCTDQPKLILRRSGRWDNKRQFLIYDNIYTGDKFRVLSKTSTSCLATLATPDRLYWLPQVVSHWGGIVSLAVFMKDSEETLFKSFFRYLRHCHPQILSHVTVHLVKPGSSNLIISLSEYLEDTDPGRTLCSNPSTVMKALLKSRVRPVTNKAVPQNHLRNVARKNCPSPFVLTTDIDIIPSHKASELLTPFLESPSVKKCGQCAYVIPTFELDDHLSFPKNKAQLLSFESKGRARPFHEKVFIHNQHATNFSRWRASGNSSEVVISHPVTEFEFFYEPFYISKDTAPPHDERFVGYGFTRNTQVYEMFLSGWSFQVLSPIFLVHWGLQKRSTRPGWREKENSNNRFLFANFKRELIARYRLDLRGHPALS